MKKLIFCLIGIATIAAIAAEDTRRAAWNKMSPEKKAALLEARRRHSGGMVILPGKGCVAVFDSQKAVGKEVIDGCIAKLREQTRNVVVKYGREPFTLASAKDTRKKLDAAAAVYVIDDPALPMSLIAVEDGWGVMNVAPLREGNPSADKLSERARKELTRVLALTFSGAKSQYQSSVFQTVQTVSDLDKIIGDNLCMDTTGSLMLNLESLGVTPSEVVSYRTACERGIAAAPTNDIQKAVWDQVHEIPSEPITIKK